MASQDKDYVFLGTAEDAENAEGNEMNNGRFWVLFMIDVIFGCGYDGTSFINVIKFCCC
jgi:hypothetical protein